jgi:hypothetical protein
MLFSFYFYLVGLFVSLSDPNIYSLLYHWNKASLVALHTAAASANTEEERKIYKNRLDVMSDIWKMEPGSVNNKSLRWLFLEQISADFDWKNKPWSVIEVKKRGERISLLNYLVCYDKKQTKIILYDYQKDRWVKVKEKIEPLKLKALVQREDKVPINEGKNFNEIIVTVFNSAQPLRSMFYVVATLSQNSIVADIISR